jgi:membrane-associated phospholipid phosphatase
MDYRVYHAVNAFVLAHGWLGHLTEVVELVAVPLFAVATCGLWLLDRPRGPRKWKLASASALAAASLALLVNRVVAEMWSRERPFAEHSNAHVWGARSHDPSFPSDHASAAFAIAFAILLFDQLVGSIFLAAAVVVAGGRVVVGAHYPSDVLAGLLVGFGSAVFVVRAGRPTIVRLVRLVERVTDPVLAPIWRRLPVPR